jgi:hypothetical protein
MAIFNVPGFGRAVSANQRNAPKRGAVNKPFSINGQTGFGNVSPPLANLALDYTLKNGTPHLANYVPLDESTAAALLVCLQAASEGWPSPEEFTAAGGLVGGKLFNKQVRPTFQYWFPF